MAQIDLKNAFITISDGAIITGWYVQDYNALADTEITVSGVNGLDNGLTALVDESYIIFDNHTTIYQITNIVTNGENRVLTISPGLTAVVSPKHVTITTAVASSPVTAGGWILDGTNDGKNVYTNAAGTLHLFWTTADSKWYIAAVAGTKGDNHFIKTTGTVAGGTYTAVGTNTGSPVVVVATTDGEQLFAAPHRLEVKIGEGNLTYSEKRNIQYVKDRGTLDYTRLGDEEPVDVSFDFVWEFIRADTGFLPTVEDALKKINEASTWVTSDADPCAPYAVNIEVMYYPPCGDVKIERILLKDFRYENLNHDLKGGTVSITGKANVVEADVTRN
jgi:hypothetical protein